MMTLVTDRLVSYSDRYCRLCSGPGVRWLLGARQLMGGDELAHGREELGTDLSRLDLSAIEG
jgi:hypothetical protein